MRPEGKGSGKGSPKGSGKGSAKGSGNIARADGVPPPPSTYSPWYLVWHLVLILMVRSTEIPPARRHDARATP